MILKGSTISNVKHARYMANHLFKDENEKIIVEETIGGASNQEGFEEDLVEMHLYSRMTKGNRSIFHVAISPRENESLTQEERDRAVELIEEKFNLQGQIRLSISHLKEGRFHSHLFWSLVDQEKQKLKNQELGFYKRKLQSLGQEMEIEFGHELTPREPSEKTFEISNSDRMREAKTGRKAQDLKNEITAIWNNSKDAIGFVQDMQRNGYQVAKGEKAQVVVIDPDGYISNLVHELPKPIKAKDIIDRFGEYVNDLESINDVSFTQNVKEEKILRAKKVEELFNQSDNGKAFEAALKDAGYTLAMGRRPVIVDQQGKIYALYKQIKSHNSQDIKSRIASSIGLENLPLATKVAEDYRRQLSRDDYETDRQMRLGDAPIDELNDKRIRAGEKERKGLKNKRRKKIPKREEKELPTYDDTHLKELDKLREREYLEDKERYELKETQSRIYKREQLKAKIKSLEKELKNRNNWRSKITGRYWRTLELLEVQRKTLANVDLRIAGQERALELKHQSQRNLDTSQKVQSEADQDRRLSKRQEIFDDIKRRKAERDTKKGKDLNKDYGKDQDIGYEW